MIKRAAVIVLVLAVGLSVVTKIVFLCIARGPSVPAKAVYALPEEKFEPFVFAGMEVALPWSRITNVFIHGRTVIFDTEDNKRFSILRMWNSSEESKKLDEVLKGRRLTLAVRMRDKLQEYLLGDLGQLSIHPERMGRFYVPRSANVTWRSNPLADFRTVMGLLYLRILTEEFEDRREMQTAFMHGYHLRMKIWKGRMDTYELGMNDGTYGLTVGMPEGTDEFAASLLSSIRVVERPAKFSRLAFEKSKSLAQASGGESSKQKRALLTAIEAASNTSPNLAYYTNVLDLCRRFHVARLAPAWLSEAMSAFPSSRDELIARYPEFYPNHRRPE